MKLLSTKQKAVLSQLAIRAYKHVGAAMGFDDAATFRRACVFDVTSKNGLTQCDQLDYIPVYNYLGGMLGLSPKVDNTPKSAHERALWVLKDSMARWEIKEAYASTIIMHRLKLVSLTLPTFTELANLCTPEELRQINYTIINRGRANTRKLSDRFGIPAPTETHNSPSTLPPGRLADHFIASVPPKPHKNK